VALTNLYGSKRAFIGPSQWLGTSTVGQTTVFANAANKGAAFIGYIETSDGASHTLNTTGASSIGWTTGSVTFDNAGTSVKVGIAAVDMAVGPPGRPVNTSDVINFTVSKTLTGGSGGIIANSWHNHVPDSGTMTIANGDLVAICVQMTALGGADSFIVICGGLNHGQRVCSPFGYKLPGRRHLSGNDRST
jgi:hypothetical protein